MSIRSRPRRPDPPASGVCRASHRRAASDSSKEWRRPCGRRPLSTTMFSTSTRCCIPAQCSTTRRTSWAILRSRFRRSAPYWRLGHRMHPRSLRAPRYGRHRASRRPSASTRYSRPCVNSMAAPAIRLVEGRTACVRLLGSWPLVQGGGHGRDQIAAPRRGPARTPMDGRFRADDEWLAAAGCRDFLRRRRPHSVARSPQAAGRVLAAAGAALTRIRRGLSGPASGIKYPPAIL